MIELAEWRAMRRSGAGCRRLHRGRSSPASSWPVSWPTWPGDSPARATSTPVCATRSCRFILVHPEPELLPELNAFPRLVRRATQHLEQLGVELRSATRVAFATPQQVTLSTGEDVPTRTIISAVGTRPNPIVAGLDLPKDERGRIRVERTGQVPGRPDVGRAATARRSR